MPTLSRALLLVVSFATLAGCSNLTTTQQRTLSGGAIGAAAGAVGAAVLGGPVLLGTALGAGAGAVAGAALSEPDIPTAPQKRG